MSDRESSRKLTAAALHASEERFHRLVDAVTDYAIFMLDPDGRVVSWNLGAANTKGYSEQEILGQHFGIFYTPEERAAGRPAAILDAVRRNGRFEDEGWRVRKDGTRFWANVVVSALRDPGGELVGFAKVTRDLTARRANEMLLHASEQRFHALVDAVTDYAIFMLDDEGCVATWNEGAKRIKGYDADEVVGHHFSMFYTAEDRAAGRPAEILERVRREGRVEDESFRVRKGGDRFWANVVITALRDDGGKLVGFAKVTRDLTERRNAEENERRLARERLARAASETERRRLMTLLAQIPAVVNFLSGPDLVFEYAHPLAIKAIGGREVLGKPLAEAVPEVREQPYYQRLVHVYETGEAFEQHEALAWHLIEGQRVDTYWSSVYLPVRQPDTGQVEGVMTFEMDVTESVRARRELERVGKANELAREELERLNRSKDEFLATMSHELRTPLNAIVGWASILKKNPNDRAQREHGLEVILRNAAAQTRIVSDLLDVSRIVSGKLNLKSAMTALSPLVHDSADVVRPAAESKGVRLLVDVDPEIGSLVADADRLRQVMWNLLINAVRFTPRGGRITVTADRKDAAIVVSVRDTGAGIAPEHLPHVFERFRQVDSSMTRAHGGLGLGLAIVRHLVELHGGTVRAESEGVGRGAEFTVWLPVRAVTARAEEEAEAHPALAEEPSDRAKDAADVAGVRILVVDDDADSLELMRVILEGAGAHVTSACAAREALSVFDREGPFDLVISDLGMPEMDGFAFCTELRGRAAVPAIALSAYARAEDAERARGAGYQAHLTKPVDEPRLLEAIRALVPTRAPHSEP